MRESLEKKNIPFSHKFKQSGVEEVLATFLG